MSHACDTCDPAVGVSETELQPGIWSFTCCGCGRELWQEHEPKPEPYDEYEYDERGRAL